jgi:hypothetical protein
VRQSKVHGEQNTLMPTFLHGGRGDSDNAL